MGNLKNADYTSVGNLSATDIAYINCDPNESDITPSAVVGSAAEIQPKAIILYSLTSQECNLMGLYTFTTMYTMTTESDSANLMNLISTFPSQANYLTATISANSTSNNQGSSSTGNDGGPAPTTAVAMSILYSITGIITLLFLIIIATGAIRAHRHPER